MYLLQFLTSSSRLRVCRWRPRLFSAHRWVGSTSSAFRNKPSTILSIALASVPAVTPDGDLSCPIGSRRRSKDSATLVRSAGARLVSAVPRLLIASTCVASAYHGWLIGSMMHVDCFKFAFECHKAFRAAGADPRPRVGREGVWRRHPKTMHVLCAIKPLFLADISV